MPTKVPTEVTGKVWQVLAAPGTVVAEGESLLVIESMKMEIPVSAPHAGKVQSILVAEGELVEEGQTVATLEHTGSPSAGI